MSVTRYGFYVGTLRQGSDDVFYRLAEDEVLPILKRFPGATHAALLRPLEQDADAPPFVLGVRIVYPDLATCRAALQSPVRTEARAAVARLLTYFEGAVNHYNLEEVS